MTEKSTRTDEEHPVSSPAEGEASPTSLPRHAMNPVERLVYRFWPTARNSRFAARLKNPPPKLLRLAIFLQNPYPIERLLERPKVLLWRLERARDDRRKLALAYGFEYVKRSILRSQLPGYRVVFLPFGKGQTLLEPAVKAAGPFTLAVWSFRDEAAGLDKDFWGDRPTIRVEDGFIRSVGLGSDGALPYSLCIDHSGLYFDASAPSDLETIANTHDFAADQALLGRADAVMVRIRESGITKYNAAPGSRAAAAATAEGPAGRLRILVIGQVEDDQSILRNRCAISTNEGLLERAIQENPDADIVFRPHPDVTSGNRRALSNPQRLLPAYREDRLGRPLSEALDGCDVVYTISSLSGFEGLMRGKKVKTFGGPFYAGWGLTEDAVSFPRRTRSLTLRELFAAAYLLYPIYFDPRTGGRLAVEDVLDRLEGR